jgi:hypothetical protein
MSEIQECYWLTPLVETEYSRKCFGIITPCTKVVESMFKYDVLSPSSTALTSVSTWHAP